jgi:hypothetical protein
MNKNNGVILISHYLDNPEYLIIVTLINRKSTVYKGKESVKALLKDVLIRKTRYLKLFTTDPTYLIVPFLKFLDQNTT